MSELIFELFTEKKPEQKEHVRFPAGLLCDILNGAIAPASATFAGVIDMLNKLILNTNRNFGRNCICTAYFATLSGMHTAFDIDIRPRGCSLSYYRMYNKDPADGTGVSTRTKLRARGTADEAAAELRRILITALNYIFPKKGSLYDTKGWVFELGNSARVYHQYAIDIVNTLMSRSCKILVKFMNGFISFTPNIVDSQMLTWLVYIAAHVHGVVHIGDDGVYHEAAHSAEITHFETLHSAIEFARTHIAAVGKRPEIDVDLRKIMGADY